MAQYDDVDTSNPDVVNEFLNNIPGLDEDTQQLISGFITDGGDDGEAGTIGTFGGDDFDGPLPSTLPDTVILSVPDVGDGNTYVIPDGMGTLLSQSSTLIFTGGTAIELELSSDEGASLASAPMADLSSPAKMARVVALGSGNDAVTVRDSKNSQLLGGAGNDKLTTGTGSDLISGGAGNDMMSAGAGNDIMVSGIGDDTVDGGNGYDVVRMDGKLSEYNITKGANNTVMVSNKVAGGPSVSLVNTEFIQFSTGSVSFTTSAREATALRMYDSLLDRAIDPNGAQFWIDLVTKGGLTLSDVAAGFMNSAEFKAKSAGLTDEQFITLIYQNALNRPAEPAGTAYYMKDLASGFTRADVAAKIIGAPEAGDANTGIQLVTGWI